MENWFQGFEQIVPPLPKSGSAPKINTNLPEHFPPILADQRENAHSPKYYC